MSNNPSRQVSEDSADSMDADVQLNDPDKEHPLLFPQGLDYSAKVNMMRIMNGTWKPETYVPGMWSLEVSKNASGTRTGKQVAMTPPKDHVIEEMQMRPSFESASGKDRIIVTALEDGRLEIDFDTVFDVTPVMTRVDLQKGDVYEVSDLPLIRPLTVILTMRLKGLKTYQRIVTLEKPDDIGQPSDGMIDFNHVDTAQVPR